MNELFDQVSQICKLMHEVLKNIKFSNQNITCEASPYTLFDNGYWTALEENKDLIEPKFLNQHFIRHQMPDKMLCGDHQKSDRSYLLMLQLWLQNEEGGI